MVSLSIFMNAEEMGRQFRSTAKLIEAKKELSIGLLQAGMTSGKPSVSIMFELPDGSVVFAETSLALFLMAANAFEAKAGMEAANDQRPN